MRPEDVWTPRDVEILTARYTATRKKSPFPQFELSEISQELGRSTTSITRKAWRLGLKRPWPDVSELPEEAQPIE